MHIESIEMREKFGQNGEDPALVARKRRIERRGKNRADGSGEAEPPSKRKRSSTFGNCDDDASAVSDAELISSGKPSIRGIKKQARYEPGVPMTKEELAKWRKEARRVRNRESAAASRQKTRERINELEAQLEALNNKYAAALHRIQELEAEKPQSHRIIFSPEVLQGASSNGTLPEPAVVSQPPSVAIPASPQTSPLSSPPLSPRESFSLHLDEGDIHCLSMEEKNHQQQQQYHQHIIPISRPTAV